MGQQGGGEVWGTAGALNALLPFEFGPHCRRITPAAGVTADNDRVASRFQGDVFNWISDRRVLYLFIIYCSKTSLQFFQCQEKQYNYEYFYLILHSGKVLAPSL